MKIIYICFSVFFITACSENPKKVATVEDSKLAIVEQSKKDESSVKKNQVEYEIGRVQTAETDCIGSPFPINSEKVTVINFNIDDSNTIKSVNLFDAVINSNAEKNCIDALIESSIDHKFKYFYGLELPDSIGITNHFILSKKLNNIPVALNIDSDYFDICYSSEGIHFNIWDSIKKKERLFHDYVYLNFDTIDNCTEKDYESL